MVIIDGIVVDIFDGCVDGDVDSLKDDGVSCLRVKRHRY